MTFICTRVPWNKGEHHSEETKRKISETLKRLNIKPPSRKGSKLSEEHKRKIGKASEGNKYSLGFKHSEETKRKHSEIHKKIGAPWMKNKHPSEETRNKLKGRIPWNKGKHLSKEIRKKLSEALIGRHLTVETRKKMSESKKGEKTHFWKGGITPMNRKIRTSFEYKLWRESVFKRDNWICQECSIRGIKLNADHIKPFALYPELRFELSNGRTLCENCHRKTDTWGNKMQKITLTN